MIILAIDTTTRGGSVAIARDDETIALVNGDEARTHGERMPGDIAQAFDAANLSRSAIDLIAVAAGPGAFTGLRIGLATAQGLALSLDRPVVGVSALDALAWMASFNDTPDDVSPQESFSEPENSSAAPWRQTFRFVGSQLVAPWMDAQRGDVVAALYKGHAVIENAITARPADVLESWQRRVATEPVIFIGDATPRDADLIAHAGRGRWTTRAPDALAPAIAQLGRRLALEGRAGRPHDLTPIYVRRPDAEIERERRPPS